MSTNNPNMDNLQNSPQFQEAVKTAVDKALSDFFSKNVVEKEEKSEGCPYLRPASPPYWKTCTERDLSDPNKEKCVPPFWLMRHHFQNQHPSCCCNQQQCPRHWNPPGRNFEGPGRYHENSHCQQGPKDWSPWWSNRNVEGPGRFGDNSNPQQAPREWRPWWSNRNADGSGRLGDNCSPQQEQKDWRPWWFNRNADGPSRSG